MNSSFTHSLFHKHSAAIRNFNETGPDGKDHTSFVFGVKVVKTCQVEMLMLATEIKVGERSAKSVQVAVKLYTTELDVNIHRNCRNTFRELNTIN